ncbi:Uncharacterized protein NEOC95_002228 [Neochlamydia sp. AcF95]|nr:Uncharacterized protein [Neochlamydia sp. AcF95]
MIKKVISMSKPKVVIVGGGFGGLNAAKALKKAAVEVLLLDKTNHHLFQPLLYQVASAALSPANIASPIRTIFSKQENVTVLLANITAVDKEKKVVIAENGETYHYDYLILAPGSQHTYFGHAEWEAFAPGLKTLQDAIRIRERILLSFERAERCTKPEETLKFLQFVIVGAGPTGVEMAGAIAEIAHTSLIHNFRHINPEHARVYLIEGSEQILSSFPKDLAEKAAKDLRKLGVEIILKTRVTEITSEGVRIGDKFIDSRNVIWAAGNQTSPLLDTLEVAQDHSGRIHVNNDLSVPGYPEIFVIGDAAFLLDTAGLPLPGIAPVAIQQSHYVARLIKKNICGKQRKPFKYFDKGMMATIGKAKAVAVVGKLKISGFIAWLAWCFIHIHFLISFANRLVVMLNWFYLYCRNQRCIRLITRPLTDKDEPIR